MTADDSCRFHARMVRSVVVKLRAFLEENIIPWTREADRRDDRSRKEGRTRPSGRPSEETTLILKAIEKQHLSALYSHSLIKDALFPTVHPNALNVLTEITEKLEALQTCKTPKGVLRKARALIRALEKHDSSLACIVAPATDGPRVNRQTKGKPNLRRAQAGGIEKHGDEHSVTVRLLLLSDLHWGTSKIDPNWTEIRTPFTEELERICLEDGGVDLVLFAGDLVKTGKKSEYAALSKHVLEKLWTHFENWGCQPELLPVCGNHDLAWPKGKLQIAHAREIIKGWREGIIQEGFWSADGHHLRFVKGLFKNYQAWWRECLRNLSVTTPAQERFLEGLLPGDFGYSYEKEENGFVVRLGVIGLNSAFLQLLNLATEDEIDKYEGRLSLSAEQFHQVFANAELDAGLWSQEQDISLLMTHHPDDWLDSRGQEDFEKSIFLTDCFLAHVCGHEHKQGYKSTTRNDQKIIRRIRSSSLCSKEPYYVIRSKKLERVVDRRHGFTVGEIVFTDQSANLRWAPRMLNDDRDRYDADGSSGPKLDGDGWTKWHSTALRGPLRQP